MPKYRIVAHHVSTDTYWYSAFVDHDQQDLKKIDDFLENICEKGSCVSLKNEHGNEHYFPKKIIQECVFTLEKSGEYD